jgi:hypothetical protein
LSNLTNLTVPSWRAEWAISSRNPSRRSPDGICHVVFRPVATSRAGHAERAISRPNGRCSDQAISAPAALILMRSPDLPHSKSFLCSVEEAKSATERAQWPRRPAHPPKDDRRRPLFQAIALQSLSRKAQNSHWRQDAIGVWHYWDFHRVLAVAAGATGTYFAALPCCSESMFLLTSDSGAHFAGRVLRGSKPQVIRGCRIQSEADNVLTPA